MSSLAHLAEIVNRSDGLDVSSLTSASITSSCGSTAHDGETTSLPSTGATIGAVPPRAAPIVAPGDNTAGELDIINSVPRNRRGTGENPSLGINAVFVRARSDRASPGRDTFDLNAWRSDLYKQQAAASKLLKWHQDQELRGLGVEPPPGVDTRAGYSRTCLCHWGRIASAVTVTYSDLHNRAGYKGVMTCGIPSTCPICGAKIAEHRRAELAMAVKVARSRGFVTALASLTMSHHYGDDMGVLLGDLRLMFRKIKRLAAWAHMVEVYGVLIGGKKQLSAMTGFENTWSDLNGHHPHLHPLFILAAGSDVAAFQCDLRDLWYTVRKLGWSGGTPDNLDAWERGCTVTSNDGDVAEYVNKFGRPPRWDVDKELASLHNKRGRGPGGRSRHYTMRELLICYSGSGDMFYGSPWLQYAVAMRGRHLLQWSPGLRVFLGLGVELSDEEVAASGDDLERDLLALGADLWHLLCVSGKRGDLLSVASAGDSDLVLAWLYGLAGVSVDLGASQFVVGQRERGS